MTTTQPKQAKAREKQKRKKTTMMTEAFTHTCLTPLLFAISTHGQEGEGDARAPLLKKVSFSDGNIDVV